MTHDIEIVQRYIPTVDYSSERPVLSEFITCENLQRVLSIKTYQSPLSNLVLNYEVILLINHNFKNKSTIKLHFVKSNIDEFTTFCKYVDYFYGRSIWIENNVDFG